MSHAVTAQKVTFNMVTLVVLPLPSFHTFYKWRNSYTCIAWPNAANPQILWAIHSQHPSATAHAAWNIDKTIIRRA